MNKKRGLRVGTAAPHPVLQLSLAFAIPVLVVLWSSLALAATLTWNANTESDLAGYRIYQCSQPSCGKTSATATLLATLGKVTSLDIGTPAVVQYYVITAYDFTNNESGESNIAVYTPASAPPTPPPAPPVTPPPVPPPPPPPASSVSLTVLGSPNLGQPWSVQATTNAGGSLSIEIWINGTLDHVERTSPYCAFGDSNGSCLLVQRPPGTYNVEFRVLSGSTELARQSVLVTAVAAPSPPPLAPPPAPANLRLGLVR
ncbi:MAG: hypothetical protein ACT4O4_05300 [Nitrospiraceae bacterium]